MLRSIGAIVALALGLACGTVARGAWADEVPAGTRAAARTLGEEALDRFDAADFAGALDRFERADALVHLPTTGLWAARCLVRLGRLVEADNRYVEVTRIRLAPGAADVLVRAQADAVEERAALARRIPRIAITIAGARGDRTIELDGHPLPRALEGVAQPVDPGPHEVALVGPSGRSVKRAVLAEGATESVVLQADATPRAAPVAVDATPPPVAHARWTRTAGVVALGTGGALLVAGAVAGALAVAKHDALAPSCPQGSCPPPYHHDADVLDQERLVASVGLIGGAAIVAAGVVLLVVAPDDPPKTGLTLQPSGFQLLF